MERIAIVGGSGLIGSRLALSFASSGVMPSVFDIVPPPDDIVDHCHFVNCDIREKAQVRGMFEGFDAVFLLASLLGKGCSADAQNGWKTNVQGTENVLMEMVRAARLPRLVFPNTGLIYASPCDSFPTSEDAVKAPVDLYATFKLAAETTIASLVRSSGMQAYILRFFSVYGPGPAAGNRGRFLATWLERARSGQPLLIHNDGEQTRDFTHVSDIVAACHEVLQAPDAPSQCMTYNIGSGQETTLNQLSQWIKEEVPGVCFRYEPEIVLPPRRYIGDISRARRELGYEPKVMAEEGVRNLLRTSLHAAVHMV